MPAPQSITLLLANGKGALGAEKSQNSAQQYQVRGGGCVSMGLGATKGAGGLRYEMGCTTALIVVQHHHLPRTGNHGVRSLSSTPSFTVSARRRCSR